MKSLRELTYGKDMIEEAEKVNLEGSFLNDIFAGIEIGLEIVNHCASILLRIYLNEVIKNHH